MSGKKFYGFFSQQAKEDREKRNLWGKEPKKPGIFYRTPDGRTVEVTYVQPDNPVLDRNFYRWPDTVAVGEVTEQVWG
jgi:hypothetical protein